MGFGYDSHRFGADRALVLGGVTVEHETGLIGHSDGDAVVHAVIDALLGAAAMGDIGRLFPNTDAAWKDADSILMLKEVRRRLEASGYTVFNVDVTVVTETPKLSPYADAMRDRIAHGLRIPATAISVKAKSNEGMDAVGERKGLEAYAVVSLGES
jgi:2-C-methyl-D-erythritol 2,4-cyclodiphosphate synthase